MIVKVKRFNKHKSSDQYIQEFEVENSNALKVLFEIKQKIDSTFAFRSSCKSAICGSCAIRVNSVEKLACKTQLNENDLIEPLNNFKIIKDLIINLEKNETLIKKSNAFLEKYSKKMVTNEDIKQIDLQSNCISCQSCYSSCPVATVNKEFKGPTVLTKVYRYLEDKKENLIKNKLELIQLNGIWDCTLCGNCTIVCPQGIDSKDDILKLRMKSLQNGYSDLSNKNSFNFGFDDNFGFNPNGF
ncbi:succinate dehydrogenase/fumarate reductase iron-sulfur subunit [Arcobacter sp. CECT 8985]|uniref:succinate dehydrogenase/fumarate reductase iron-sulfur subunit n=1 Tax=Arcobacter sp. CECT 8985 TaxID=1935424 RepID=UPI00100AFA56|nr:2Fe-2S iron-sulfur cluster-binding protein [Arcobacter sp. CECT 8985]RXJ86881.1 succinate dehydrogenase [Arcobacter sp. CECT 8985]